LLNHAFWVIFDLETQILRFVFANFQKPNYPSSLYMWVSTALTHTIMGAKFTRIVSKKLGTFHFSLFTFYC
jgi:hypothetical protein